MLYSPTVVFAAGRYRMWYVGNSSTSRRADDHCLGYAESEDGLHWRPHPDNPIATPRDLPWGSNWQTPCVLYDAAAGRYRMWFIATTVAHFDQHPGRQDSATRMESALGYAESEDGLAWRIHPRPVYPSGRGPCVLPVPGGGYRMWMCSRPAGDVPWDQLYQNIYEFASPDGLAWTRRDAPAITPAGERHSCVYPCVREWRGAWLMWYGAHIAGNRFAVYGARSADGHTWTTEPGGPVLPPSGVAHAFDGRYTSTPCVLIERDRWLLYYSGRSLTDEYHAGDGTIKRDTCGVYHGLGVAVLPGGPPG